MRPKARAILDRLYAGGAGPSIAPARPTTKPTTRPKPNAPTTVPKPGRPDPWRPKPGEDERPKARALRREALEFLRMNGFEDIVG